MSRPIHQLFTVLSFGVFAVNAHAAEVPQVVTDIPATDSLVSMVMGDLGKPQLLLEAGSNPHDYALKPSKAAALNKADIIFWTSAELTPWLPRAITSLAPKASTVELISSPHTRILAFRESNHFSEHSEQAESAHAHKGSDPHAWLDPVNAGYWVLNIANALGEQDPENRSTYLRNAELAAVKLQELTEQISNNLHSVKTKPFIVFHDSYHYFEERFDIHAVASISLSDASQPSIRQIKKLRSTLSLYPGVCVFSEPQFSDRLIKTITRGQQVDIAELDPLGIQLSPGMDLYRSLLLNLSMNLKNCLAGSQYD